MRKEEYEITDSILGSLGSECPNCEGEIRNIKDWKLRCNSCGMDIHIQSRGERLFLWGFMGAVLIFALGYIIGLVI